MDQHDGSVPHSGNDSTTTTSTSSSSGDAVVPSIDNSVPLTVTRIATIGYATSTGDWIDEEKLARPLKDTATEISLCIDARKEKVKNDFLQKQENLTDEDKQFIRDTKDRKKRQGKKALWALTWWDDQKRKTLPELWQKAKESNITHNLSDVKLVIRRNVLNSLANMLYTKENEQKHHHKFEHPQEYCVEKRDGALFLDVIRSNYELREWRFGRDILGKAMESAFIDNTDIELYNTLIIQGKGEFQVGITADFGYTDIDGSPCELAPISSDRVNDEKRILNSWIRAKLGGIAKITKVVYDRAPGKPISITETVTDEADTLETPGSFPGFDLLFDTLLDLINLANSLPDGIYYTLYRPDSGFAAFTPTRREEIRKRVYTHPPRGGYYGGGRGGGFHRQDHHNGRGGRPPMHHQHQHHHHQQPPIQAQLYYQPAALQQEPSVYIRNLPFDIVREELIEFFSLNNCKVKEIHFHHDHATSRLKGSAIVDFFDFESFSLALGLSGQQVKGRSIEVRIARKPSSSISSGESRAERDEHWERGKRSDRGGADGQYPPGYPHHAGPHYRGGPPRGYPPYVHGIVPVGYFPSYDRSFRGRGRGGSYYGGGAASGSAPGGGRGGSTNWTPNHRSRGHQHHQHHQHHQQAVQEQQHKQEEQQQQF